MEEQKDNQKDEEFFLRLPDKKTKRFPIKKLIGAVILLAIILTLALLLLLRGKDKGNSPKQPGTNTKTETISMLATGDWIAHDSVNTAARTRDGYDYMPLVEDFLPVFKKTDIRFCNDPILNGGEDLGITGYPYFNSPAEFVSDMGRLGCNVVGTASNHSFDFTQANITASVNAWKKVPDMLAVAGQNSNQVEHDKVRYFTVKGVKFAFLAYTTYINADRTVENSYGVNIFSKDFAAAQIADAKKNKADIIIASMRWGTEYATEVDAAQLETAQWLADQGVGIVLGHGSHQLQPVAQLDGINGNKTVVWYGLGNFLNSQEPAETLFNGLAVMSIDSLSKQVSIKGYLPVYMHYTWTAAQAAEDDIAARKNLRLYLLEDATQSMVDAQQLKTTITAQKSRMSNILGQNGLDIPLLTSDRL